MNRTLVVALAAIGLFAGAALGGLTTDPPAPAKPAADPLVGATLLPRAWGATGSRSPAQHPEVQRWFDQGLMLTFGFNHDAAERSFLKATELDPDCAMCWWGAALVLGPHVNSGMDPAQQRQDAWTRLQRAVALAPRATDARAGVHRRARRRATPSTRRRTGVPLDEAYAQSTGRLAQDAARRPRRRGVPRRGADGPAALGLLRRGTAAQGQHGADRRDRSSR